MIRVRRSNRRFVHEFRIRVPFLRHKPETDTSMSRSSASSGAILRDIQHTTTRMKKVRKLMTELRVGSATEEAWAKAATAGLDAAKAAAAIVANLPEETADPDLLLKAVQMQRYATGLIVRVRRIKTALSREGGYRDLAGAEAEFEYDGGSDEE